MNKLPLLLLLSAAVGCGWLGCASPAAHTARLDALVRELAAAPAWSELQAGTLSAEGAKLVAVCRKTTALSLRDLRYVEFHYLEKFETARLKMTTVIDAEGTSHQRPFPVITIEPENRENYRKAWSKIHVLHRIYFAVPDVPASVPATRSQWRNQLYPLVREGGGFRLAGLPVNETLADPPRSEFAYLAATYGSRHSGEKARYDF